jgi:hypothetical protein
MKVSSNTVQSGFIMNAALVVVLAVAKDAVPVTVAIAAGHHISETSPVSFACATLDWW